MIPATLALVLDTFESGPDRHKALAILGGMGGIAGAAGTVLGGLLTALAWQAAFLVFVPIIALVLAFGIRILPSGGPVSSGGMDVWGAVTGTGGLCRLFYAVLTWSNEGWTGRAVPGAVAAVVLLIAFVVRQVKAAVPLIPRQVFAMRNVVLGNAANLLLGTAAVRCLLHPDAAPAVGPGLLPRQSGPADRTDLARDVHRRQRRGVDA